LHRQVLPSSTTTWRCPRRPSGRTGCSAASGFAGAWRRTRSGGRGGFPVSWRAVLASATRPGASHPYTSPGPIAPIGTTHRSDVLFTFVLAGTVTLEAARPGAHSLEEGDAYVVSPDLETALGDVSSNLDLLEVALPAVAPAASPAS
jgi:hypothetical protein